MPSFFAWLFRPAFKDNKVISSFSTFLRLLLSFFDIPRIISRFSESLVALRIPSLPSVPLLFFLLSDFRASWCSTHRLAGLCVSSLTSFCLLSFYLLLLHLIFSFSSLSLSLSLSLHIYLYLFHLYLYLFYISSISSISSISISSSSLVLYCVFFFSFSSLSHLTFPAYLSLLSHYPRIDS